MICIALCTFAEPHVALLDEKGSIFSLGVHIDCAASIFALGQTPVGRGLTFAYQQAYYTHIGRQQLMERVLDVKDLEAVVFIDGDMAFSPQDFEDLVHDGRMTGGMVGAFYPSRQKLGEVIGTVISDDPNAHQSPVPVECSYIGMGFTWVPAQLFRTFKKKPWVDVVNLGDGRWTLEDMYFSRKVREETPYKIWGRRFDGVSHAFNTRRSMDTMLVTGGGV